MRVSIVNEYGHEMGFTFSLKKVKSDDVWLKIKKVIETSIDEDAL